MGNRPPGAPGYEMPNPQNGQNNGQNQLNGQNGQNEQNGQNNNNNNNSANQFPPGTGDSAENNNAPPLQHSMSHELIAENNMAQVDPNNINNINNMNNKHFSQSPGPPPPTGYNNAQPPPANMTYVQNAQNNNNNNIPISNIGGKCAHIGCRCNAYSESQSKWSKGQCKTCNHSENEHKKQNQAQFAFDTNKTAKAPIQSQQSQQAQQAQQSQPKQYNMMYNSPKGLPPKKPLSQQNGSMHNMNTQRNNNPQQQSQSIFNPNMNNIEAQSPPGSKTDNNNNNNYNQPPRQSNGSVSGNRQYIQSQPSYNNINMNKQPNISQSNISSTNVSSNIPPNRKQWQSPNKSFNRLPNNPPNKKSLPTPPMTKSRSASNNNISNNNLSNNNNKNKNTFKKPPTRSMEIPKNVAGIASLQAVSSIKAQNKESIYMDMTIAQVEKMQAKRGNAQNKINTQNLDKNKTVRQILEEQKQLMNTQNQANNILNSINDKQKQPQPQPKSNPWGKPSNAWNNALKTNNNNMNNNNNNRQPQQHQRQQPQQQQQKPQQQKPQQQQQPQQPQPQQHMNYNNRGQQFQPNTRIRATSNDSGNAGNQYISKPNYNQPRPFSNNNNNNNNNNNKNKNKNNNNNFRPPPPKAFQAMAGFQPTAATGLQAKNIGQKMGPQALQHKPIQQPKQNPWNNRNNNNNNNYRPPPPNNNFRHQQQQQPHQQQQQQQQPKYNHNFRNKSYNKKEVRSRQQKKQQPTSFKPHMDGTQYDSDESVFVTQAEIARRHSWGSSSLEPTVKKQPFGKPVYMNQNNKNENENENENENKNNNISNISNINSESTKSLVSKLELSEKSFYKKYWIEDGTVGSGSFAKVRKVTRKKDKKEFALKMIKKAGKTKEDLEALQREIAILAKLCHPNVVKLLDWCETKKRIYMVVQFCSGGDVFERILKQKTFSEKEAAHVVRKVSEGLEHVHANNIIHRDLKPDNLMYLTKDPDSNIMLIDFGLAGDAVDGTLSTPCGTAHYVAPEVLSSKPYNSKADMWSLGVIIYMLLCGFPPFFDAQGNQKRLYKLIKLGKYRFPSPYWDYVSEQAKDLIKNLLQLDPQKRYSATQVLKHKWINKSADSDDIDLGKMYMEQMEHFSSSRHFIDDGLKLHNKIPGPNNIGVVQNHQYQKKTQQPIQYFKHKQHAPKYDW